MTSVAFRLCKLFTLLFAVTLHGATGKNSKTSLEFSQEYTSIGKKLEVVVAWGKKSIAVADLGRHNVL